MTKPRRGIPAGLPDVVIDITPLGWSPPSRRDEAHQEATWRAARRFFPEAKRVEVNQWGRLVVIIEDHRDRQRSASRAVYAVDVQRYRENVDKKNGWGKMRAELAEGIDSVHLGVREFPAPPGPPPELPAWARNGELEALDDLEMMPQDELEQRLRGCSVDGKNDRSCRECSERYGYNEMVRHADSCPLAPILAEFVRREAILPRRDEYEAMLEFDPSLKDAIGRVQALAMSTLEDVRAFVDVRKRMLVEARTRFFYPDGPDEVLSQGQEVRAGDWYRSEDGHPFQVIAIGPNRVLRVRAAGASEDLVASSNTPLHSGLATLIRRGVVGEPFEVTAILDGFGGSEAEPRRTTHEPFDPFAPGLLTAASVDGAKPGDPEPAGPDSLGGSDYE